MFAYTHAANTVFPSLAAYTLAADPGTYAVTGAAATLSATHTPLAADPGTYAVTGAAATFRLGFGLTADPGTYTVTGSSAVVSATRALAAVPGAYALTGVAATFPRTYRLTADPGSYSITGPTAGLFYGHGYFISADPGTYAVTGVAAALIATHPPLAAVPGAYAITGAAVTFRKGFKIVADPGAYAVTGAVATLVRPRSIAAVPGSYTVTGVTAVLKRGRKIAADRGVYAITGRVATLTRTGTGAEIGYAGRPWIDETQPRTLVELDWWGTPKRYSSYDISHWLWPYPWEGLLVEEPTITRRMVDVLWGPIEVQDVTVVLANGDRQFNAGYNADMRGLGMSIKRWDMRYGGGALLTEWTGVVDQASLTADGTLELHGTNLDLAIFDQELPKAIISTVNTPKSIDIGVVIPLVFGEVAKVWLPNVTENTATNEYHYIICGNVSFAQLYRDGPNDTLVPIGTGEYTVHHDLYSTDYTTVAFTLRQVNFQGGPHKIYADVHGLAGERNFARAIQYILGNSLFGLGLFIDGPSFDAAAAILAAEGGLYCDGALSEKTKAKDILRQLLMVRGMRLGVNNVGAWGLTVDTQPDASNPFVIRDGPGLGEMNLVSAGRRTRTSMKDRPKFFSLKYRYDFVKDEWLFTASRSLSSSGREVVEEQGFIRQHDTADKVCDYLGKRMNFEQETIEDVEVANSARVLTEGQLASFEHSILTWGSPALMRVQEIRKPLATVNMTLVGYDSSIYTYTPHALPPDDLPDDFDDLSRTAPLSASGLGVIYAGTELGVSGGVEAWVDFAWTAPSVNCAGVNLYWFSLGSTHWAGGTQVLSPGYGHVKIAALIPGTLYHFMVITFNAFGVQGSPAAIYNYPAGTLNPPAQAHTLGVYAAGTVIGATGGLEMWVTVEYSTPTTNCVGANLYYKKSGESIWGAGHGVNLTGATLRNTFRGLIPGLTYDFAFVTINQFGTPGTLVWISYGLPGMTPPPAAHDFSFGYWGNDIAADGTNMRYAYVGWVVDAPAVGSRLDLKKNGDAIWHEGYVVANTVGWTPQYVRNLLSGTTYNLRVIAFDQSGVPATTGATMDLSVPNDDTVPGTPGAPNAVAGATHMLLFWFPSSESDLASYDVTIGTGAGDAISGVTGASYGGSAHRSGPGGAAITQTIAYSNFTYGVTYFARIRARDNSGNVSQWSPAVSWVHTQTNTGDINPGAIKGGFSLDVGGVSTLGGGGGWQGIAAKNLNVQIINSQIHVAAYVNCYSATGTMTISVRVNDVTLGMSHQPMMWTLTPGAIITPTVNLIIDPSMVYIPSGNHFLQFEIKGDSTPTSNSCTYGPGGLESWEQKR